MAFTVSKYKYKTFTYDEDGISFKLFFEFPYKEERNYDVIRNKLLGKGADDEEVSVGNFALYTIRNSMVGCEDIVDEEGNPIQIKNEDGTINEFLQCEVFENITNLKGVINSLMVLYTGVSAKN